uniref:Reverse transcriptase domain-containing protein n=1 Tax=Lactuca sativa TaxID=4236 RepID=A0A9R1XAU9_LACSA|nr:hypothetical protein LSAT_V11C500287660 [Lactuca sativa]
MEFMGFGVKWRSWIQGLLKNARLSVLVNGSSTEEFQLFRGLRQGDSISTFLFLIDMEGLHIAMEDAVASGNFRGVEIEKANLEISHLFMPMMLYFWSEVISLASITGCAAANFPFSYLGISVGGSMSRVSSWDVIVDRFRKRLSKWKVKMLSIGGRLTLDKSVLGSLGIYFFSLFRMSVKWDIILNSRDKGGLQFGILDAFNRALLVKWKWRFLHEQSSLWVRFIKGLFGLSRSLLNDVRHSGGRGVWQTIVDCIKNGKGEYLRF